MKRMLIILFALSSLLGCEDSPILDYEPKYVVEAFLLIDHPIENIYIYISQPITDTFRYENSLVSDATVTLYAGSRSYSLTFDATRGYCYPDTTVRIASGIEYTLEITFPDGKRAYGTTRTPERIYWIQPPKDRLQYPKDPLNYTFPDSLKVEWSLPDSLPEGFIVSYRCLDTLNYGKYLSPPTEEKNERVESVFANFDQFPAETNQWGFIAANWMPIVWYGFKWYGLHEIAVYNPDQNFINWYKLTRFSGSSPRYNPLLGSVHGDAIGVVGSAAVIRDTTFIIKPPKE